MSRVLRNSMLLILMFPRSPTSLSIPKSQFATSLNLMQSWGQGGLTVYLCNRILESFFVPSFLCFFLSFLPMSNEGMPRREITQNIQKRIGPQIGSRESDDCTHAQTMRRKKKDKCNNLASCCGGDGTNPLA